MAAVFSAVYVVLRVSPEHRSLSLDAVDLKF